MRWLTGGGRRKHRVGGGRDDHPLQGVGVENGVQIADSAQTGLTPIAFEDLDCGATRPIFVLVHHRAWTAWRRWDGIELPTGTLTFGRCLTFDDQTTDRDTIGRGYNHARTCVGW